MSRTSETVTVLFTDLVGSTELLREGAQSAHEVQAVHATSARAAVEAHHGDVIKGVGDGIMAIFRSATEAVACAAAIQQSAQRAARLDPRHPLVRVGLSAGEAIHDGGDWFGRPVVEAARLCGSEGAAGGQVLATGVVVLLIGGEDNHLFRPIEPRHLKGFDAPVELFEVVWRQAPTARVPFPSAAERATGAVFVGRTEDSARLADLWADVEVVSSRIVLVAGEPGMGKTRLVAKFAREVHEGGATVLWGACDEEFALPYRPFVQVLQHWFAHASDAQVRAVLTRGDVVRVIPELADRFPDLPSPVVADPDLERLRLFEHVAEILNAIASEGTVLVVLDDLHWATAPTLQLLCYLVRRACPSVMIVGTYRDTDIDGAHPLAAMLADFRREPNVERLQLGGLDQPAIAEYLDQVMSEAHRGSDALATRLRTETRGNPFFIGEVVRHLEGSGAWPDDGEETELSLPEGVREVIGRRLGRLSTTTNRALEVGAVMGGEFELEIVEAVPSLADAGTELLDALDEAVNARLINELSGLAGRYSFAHALVRQTVLGELTHARQARIHHEVARALLDRGAPDPTQLAYHFCAGTSIGGTADAVVWSTRAADAAMERLATEEALEILERARAVIDRARVPDPRERAIVYVRLSGVRQAIGDSTGAKEAAAQAAADARRAGDPLLFADAVNSYVAWGEAGLPDPTSAALLAEALDMIGDDHLAARAMLISQTAFYRAVYESRGFECDADARAAVALARRAGDPVVLREVVGARALILMGSSDVEAQREVLREIEALAGNPSSPRQRLFTRAVLLRQYVVIHLQEGDAEGSRRAAAELAALYAGSDQSLAQSFIAMWDAMFHLMEGRLDEAAKANAILREDRDVNFVNSWAAQLFMLRREQGQVAELMPVVDAVADATPGLVALRAIQALAHSQGGNRERGGEILHELTASNVAALPRDATWSSGLANLAEAAALLEDREAAEALYPQLLAYERQLLVVAWGVVCLGAVDRFLGMLDTVLGRYDDAERRFAAALDLEERSDAAALATRTRLWWARMCRERDGDLARARVLLDEAAATAVELHLDGLAREIAAFERLG